MNLLISIRLSQTHFFCALFLFMVSAVQALETGKCIFWGDVKSPDSALEQITAIAQGSGHCVGLKSDGTLVCWGSNWSGESMPPEGSDYVAVAAGTGFSIALKSDGSIVGWGTSEWGNLPTPSGNDYVAIDAEDQVCMALKTDGSIVCWGETVVTAPEGSEYKMIEAAPWGGLYALRQDGSIAVLGPSSSWFDTPAETNLLDLAVSDNFVLALKSDGSILAWQYGEKVDLFPGTGYQAIAAGSFCAAAIKSDGALAAYRKYSHCSVPEGNDFVAVSVGYENCLALRSDGTLVEFNLVTGVVSPDFENSGFTSVSAGLGRVFALGANCRIHGWPISSVDPANLLYARDYAAIDAERHCLALKSDGSIFGWGSNYHGEATPPAGNDFMAVAAGGSHSLALKTDGTVIGWGYNGSGQASPPANAVDCIAIDAGSYSSLALKADGSLLAWGGLTPGVPEGNDFTAISAGLYHCLALKADGSIVGWGRNNYGQASPPAGNNFIAVAAGTEHSLALKADGTIIAWGDNSFGQTTLPAGNNFIAIAARYNTSAALQRADAGCLYDLEGDLNNDCKVDILDLVRMSSNWLLDCNDTPSTDGCFIKM